MIIKIIIFLLLLVFYGYVSDPLYSEDKKICKNDYITCYGIGNTHLTANINAVTKWENICEHKYNYKYNWFDSVGSYNYTYMNEDKFICVVIGKPCKMIYK